MFKHLILPVSLFSAIAFSPIAHADSSLLNVSYDVTREFYKDYNPAFAKYWKQKTGVTVTIKIYAK